MVFSLSLQIILPLSLGLILLALALVMVYLRYRQARHLAGLGIWFDLVFDRKLGRKWNRKFRTFHRSVTVQTIAKRGYRLFGQWNVYVNLLHIRNVSLRNCRICYVTFWIYTVSVCLFSSFFQVISLQETSSFSSVTHNWWVMSIYLFDRLLYFWKSSTHCLKNC